jgi:serine protease Do
MQPMSKDIALSQGLSGTEGVLVRSVTAGSPAEKAGVKAGDAIMAVNGAKVKDTGDLARKIGALSPNSIANLDILRSGRAQRISVTLGTFPSSRQLARLQKREPVQQRSAVTDELGMVLVAASKRSGANAPGVLITKVAPGSDAADKGLKSGDIILQIGGDDVNQPDDVARGVKQAKELGRKAILLRVKSGNRYRFVGLQISKR